MKIERSEQWWRKKAAGESGTVGAVGGAAQPKKGSLKTISPIFTEEEERQLRELAQRYSPTKAGEP